MTSSRPGAEEMASWRAGRRGDGVLEGVSGVGGEADVGLSAPSAESRVAAARERIRSDRERGPDSISR